MKEIELTKSQEILLKKLIAFLQGPDKFFLLKGKPGVGKTFVIGIALRKLLEIEKSSNEIKVAGICLAHQAKKQLRNSIPNSYTFAKAYGLKEKYDEVTGERDFVFNKNFKGQMIGKMPLDVFVHDEISQYTNKMLKIVEENTSFTSKVIFIGDKAQLPPIEKRRNNPDSDSAVFNWGWHDENSHTLTERVRQAGDNPILELSDLMRDEIFGTQNIKRVLFMLEQIQMDQGVGYCKIKEEDIFPTVKSLYDSSHIIISHTNDRVGYLNRSIRNQLHDYPQMSLIKNDIVYMKDNWSKLDNDGYPVYKLENSETFKIFSTHIYKDSVSVAGLNIEIDVIACKLYDTDNIFYAPTKMGYLIFNKFLNQLYSLCQKRTVPWKVYWDMKNRYCQYNYAHAITSYKCQGSTYDNVLIDINDILTCYGLTPKRKLQSIYTAMTRARFGAYFIK